MRMMVSTYIGLEELLRGHANGHGNLLVIIGAAGLQKSVLAEKTCHQARRLSGSVTAFEMYRELWRYRDRDFIVDDVDDLYRDKTAIRQLKSLCDTRAIKSVHWHSSAAALNKEDIPTEFTTKTRLILIANEWRTLNRNVGALQDRGIVLNFMPSAEEVHARTCQWFKDGEIYDFIGHHLPQIKVPSMRHYKVAADLKAMGLDWRNTLLQTWNTASPVDQDLSVADIIYRALQQHPAGLDRTQIHGLFSRNRKASEINDALFQLMADEKVQRKMVPNAIGRPREVFVAVQAAGSGATN